MSTSLQRWRHPLWILAAAALIAGILLRFDGLGRSPFAVDEYYLARSVENILHSGIPAFDCGGLYMRGLILQYSAAALEKLGFSGELATRSLSAFATVLAIPAVFILGSRLRGRSVGLLAVIIMALSVWEIEMARFGRMYAPFQAIFLWYMVFFMRYTAERERAALWPMIALSAAAPFIWEGGVFLPLANLLALLLLRWPNRLQRADWTLALGCSVLLGAALWLTTADFRGYNAASWPAGYVRSMSVATPDSITTLALPFGALRQHLAWALAAIVPAWFTLGALRWIWSLRPRLFASLGLAAMLSAAIAHQFLVVGAVGVLLVLMRMVPWAELCGGGARRFWLAIATWASFWLAFGIAVVEWHTGGLGVGGGLGAGGVAHAGGFARTAAMLAYPYFAFPGFITGVVRPWAAAVPVLGTLLLVLVGASIIHAMRSEQATAYERILLIAFLVFLLLTSASPQPREETRYIFFLYPVAVVIALGTLARWIERYVRSPAAATAATSVVALLGFALCEDFQPYHLLHINERVEAFRIGFTPGMQSHLVIRDDYRAVARWLEQHESEHAIVVNDVHGLDHYYSGIKFFYVDRQDSNFPDWSCRRGTVERWGNYPLLDSAAALQAAVAANPAYLVVFGYNIDQIMLSLAALHPRVAMTEGNIVILALQG